MKILHVGVFILILISGYLSADEPPINNNNEIVLNLDTASEVLVNAFIDPIEFTRYDFHVEWDTLANLRAAEPEKRHAASVFRAFLPDGSVSVGELWKIELHDGILTLLKQLHPNPQMDMVIDSGDSRGAWACLRAYNAQFAEIVFRIHAQFVLGDGLSAPSEGGLFTPSQFAGKLIITRNDGKINFFQMHVPEGTLNFDVGWKQEGNQWVIADSGFCPRMELLAGTQNDQTQFAVSIPQEEAERKLILQFYKSQQINWVAMDRTLEMAQMLQKPIHAVAVDGPLDDEAC